MKKLALTLAVVAIAAMLCACSSNAGIIAPVDGASKTAGVAFAEAGAVVGTANTDGMAVFSYRWTEPVEEARVWAELYRDGSLISDPVEIRTTQLSSSSGTIALFMDDENGTEQNFSLLLTNGSGSDAKVYLQTGSLELGEAMSPLSQVTLEETQITQTNETNVLLVMHDGPDLTTEMNNNLDVGQTEQLIAGSTYTLVLNCMFA